MLFVLLSFLPLTLFVCLLHMSCVLLLLTRISKLFLLSCHSFVHFVIPKIMNNSEVRLARVCGLYSGRVLADRYVGGSFFSPEVWTLYNPIFLRKSHVYCMFEVYVPLSSCLNLGRPNISLLRRTVISAASYCVVYRSGYSRLLLSHYAFCALRYNRNAKEYHCVIAFRCNIND